MAKHIVITGCDRGIGKCLAQMLSKQGHRLTLGFQNLEDKYEVENSSDVAARHLNLANISSVAQFAEDIKDCHVLINNAGTMVGNIRKINGVEETMLTNHLG
jgi:NAD(P)-dependent dehydrogenase (short-subunit alcohol dehydrogenase family)